MSATPCPSPSVVVTGRSVLCALAQDPEQLHLSLAEGREPLGPVSDSKTRRGIQGFAAERFLAGRSLRPLDRTAALATVAAQWALEDSGWSQTRHPGHETPTTQAPPDSGRSPEIALVLGTMYGSVETISAFDRRVVREGPIYAKPYDFANSVINAAAGQVAIWHGLRGVNSTLAGGPAASLQAIAYAADLIRLGHAEVVLAGGAEELSSQVLAAFRTAGLLATRDTDGPPRPIPFDRRRNGFALGEGAAFLVLESMASANRRGAKVLAEVLGHANGFDTSRGKDSRTLAHTISTTLRLALEDAALEPDEVDALSSSANGSRRGDAAEARGIADCFGRRARSLPITAVKAMLGEALGASGAFQATALVESMAAGVLPGVRGLEERESDFPLDAMQCESQPLSLRYGVVNAVGLDGQASALVLARPEERAA